MLEIGHISFQEQRWTYDIATALVKGPDRLVKLLNGGRHRGLQ